MSLSSHLKQQTIGLKKSWPFVFEICTALDLVSELLQLWRWRIPSEKSGLSFHHWSKIAWMFRMMNCVTSFFTLFTNHEIDSLITRFHSLITRFHWLITRFHSLITRFHSLITRFDSLITRFDSLITRFHSLITRFHSLITRFHSLITRFDSVCVNAI